MATEYVDTGQMTSLNNVLEKTAAEYEAPPLPCPPTTSRKTIRDSPPPPGVALVAKTLTSPRVL